MADPGAWRWTATGDDGTQYDSDAGATYQNLLDDPQITTLTVWHGETNATVEIPAGAQPWIVFRTRIQPQAGVAYLHSVCAGWKRASGHRANLWLTFDGHILMTELTDPPAMNV